MPTIYSELSKDNFFPQIIFKLFTCTTWQPFTLHNKRLIQQSKMLRGIIFSIILLIKHYLNKYLSGPDILFGDLYSRSRIFWEFLRIESFDDWDVKDLDQMEEDSWNNSCIYDTRKKFQISLNFLIYLTWEDLEDLEKVLDIFNWTFL